MSVLDNEWYEEPGRGLSEDEENPVAAYSEDELDDRYVFRPKEISFIDMTIVYSFLESIIRHEYNYDRSIDLLNRRMNTPTKLEYLVNRIFKEASKLNHSYLYSKMTRLTKMCSKCCSMTWIEGKGRNKTFKEFLVDRVSKEFHSAASLRNRINYVLKDYKGLENKKEQWSNLRMKEFLPMFHPKCIKFVHALILESILVPGDIHLFLEELLQIPDERSLDILNDLLTELGEDFELRRYLGRTEKVADDSWLNPYLLKVRQIAYSSNSDISEELREKLLTLVNLRKRSWLKVRY